MPNRVTFPPENLLSVKSQAGVDVSSHLTVSPLLSSLLTLVSPVRNRQDGKSGQATYSQEKITCAHNNLPFPNYHSSALGIPTPRPSARHNAGTNVHREPCYLASFYYLPTAAGNATYDQARRALETSFFRCVDMATHDGGGLSAQAAVDLTSDSESDSSYAGSGESGPHSSNCQWRTERFNDQECSRYFDCPTHIVERALSQDEEDDDDHTHTHTHNYNRYDHEEQEDVEMADHDDDHSEAGTVSPISEESGSDGHESPRSYMGVSPFPGLSMSGDGRSTPGDRDEVEITGSRTISDGAQANEVDRHSTPTGAASGTSENPIILLDDSPTWAPVVQQPNITPSSASISYAQPVTGRTASASSTQVYGGHRISNSGAGAGGERPAALPAIPTYEEFMASGLAPPPARIRPSLSADRPDPRSAPEFVLPRWQPDAEVTYCPICRTQFSIFVRKHHCRLVPGEARSPPREQITENRLENVGE